MPGGAQGWFRAWGGQLRVGKGPACHASHLK